ncbi:MAG: ribonucleotide reductase subunit alpha [Gammaproteobacteria bacterium]|nr:ribonucleotide reductase subunit alpha [Gammaproteobacteria bacterium]MDE1984571.1 ribonucleotide reductase subunit alpha [Gammaproteobacteria bacterium]MDE2109218.1 ribonucleotide reductase subunit alpha [Gammaproteobacteria bacterium]MDE2459962.1 ribonucleotide reductase subunit alpha [Gammaproteobacteria bacterium]
MATPATLADFEALLQASKQQAELQRLLFVFVRRELDEHATSAQRESFARGEGGHLQPCLCVDKAPDDIASFAALVAESEHTGQHWDIVFVSSLEGLGGIAPNSDEAGQPLRFMVNAINDGRVGEFAAFDREGRVLHFL